MELLVSRGALHLQAFASGRLHDSGDRAGFVANRSPLEGHADSRSIFPQALDVFAASESSVFGGSQELFAGRHFVDWQQHSYGPPGDFRRGVSIEALCSSAPQLDRAIE